MSDLETLKAENEKLKTNLDACTGELADARSISMQLRINFIALQKHAIEFQGKIQTLQQKIKELEEQINKEPEPLKEVSNLGC